MGVQQEVCHKHRNIRRENVLRVRAPKSWQRCLFFIVDSGAPACIQHQSHRFIFAVIVQKQDT
jgi:hypothetical protein